MSCDYLSWKCRRHVGPTCRRRVVSPDFQPTSKCRRHCEWSRGWVTVSHVSASIRTYAHTTYARHPYTYQFLRTTTQLICHRAHTRSRHFGDMSARHDILPTSAFPDDKNRRHVFADMSPTLPTCLPDTTCRPFWGASRHDTTPTFPTKLLIRNSH